MLEFSCVDGVFCCPMILKLTNPVFQWYSHCKPHMNLPTWCSNWFVYCPRIVPVKISKQKVCFHCFMWRSHERSLVAGIPTPLKNMTSSVGMIIPFPTVSGKSCHKIPFMFQSPPTRILFYITRSIIYIIRYIYIGIYI